MSSLTSSARSPISPAKVEEIGLVTKEVNDLSRNLNIIFELLDKLEARINPILRPSAPVGCDKTASGPMIVPLANELKTQNDRLVSVRDRIIEIRDRVEL